MVNFCLLVFVFVAVVIVGRLVWLLLARLFRELKPQTPSFEEQLEKCFNCSCLVPHDARRCPDCGLKRSEAIEVSDLRITARQLKTFRDWGRIDETSYHHAMNAIRDRERFLRGEGRRKPRRDRVETSVPHTAAEEPITSRILAENTQTDAPPGNDAGAPLSPTNLTPIVPEVAPENEAPSETVVSTIPATIEPPESSPAPASQPIPPAASWGEWFATFLEQRNIFWGELVGGLLVVGCSIALVLSLWQTLETIPLFPFLATSIVTLALFGVGRYSLSHWRLESSSRGLLVIATLLVPLNFLVLAGISPKSDNVIELLAKVAALACFAFLVRSADWLARPFSRHCLCAISVLSTPGFRA
jgi:hypothetical protein